MVRRCVVRFVVVVALACCGSRTASEVNQSAESAAASPVVDFVQGLVASAHVDEVRAVGELCAAWQSSRGDSMSVNDYVNDLLAPLDRVNAGEAVLSHEAISAAMTSACSRYRAEPAQFVASVASELQISVDDLKARVTEACSRYRSRLARDRASGYTGNKDLDPFIQRVSAHAGADGAALRRAVDDICPT